MKQPENRIWSMILARKVLSLKNSSINRLMTGLVALNILILFENQVSLQRSHRKCGYMFKEVS